MSMREDSLQIKIELWSDLHLDLLRRLNAPEMLDHLGGIETEEQVLKRHNRYAQLGSTGKGCMFSIVLLPEGVYVGNVGYWERDWQGQIVYETGWGVLPEYQGRGIAAAASAAAVAHAAAEGKHRYIHAYPSYDNAASNAICRKLGFSFLGESAFEYPPGNVMRCNDWRLDLAAIREEGKA